MKQKENVTLLGRCLEGRPSGRPFFRPESRVAYRPVTEPLLPPRFRTQHEGRRQTKHVAEVSAGIRVWTR